MGVVEKANQTQLNNIQKKTGKTLAELEAMVQKSGLEKHSEIRTLFMQELGLGYGDANALARFFLKSDEERATQVEGAPIQVNVNDIYSDARASLLPVHERLMAAIQDFGEFEIAPKKGYLSLRRKKQFAMIGPATNTRLEVGINHKALSPHPRLLEQPAGGMCNYKVKVTQMSDVDDELISWLKQAYDSAG